MLIRDAEVHGHGRADLRIVGSRIAAIGKLAAMPGETLIDANGGFLLPGLHDHHIHLAALAAQSSSVFCGPPAVTDAAGLALALARPGTGWLRGAGYHESVMALPDARELDRLVPDRPLRMQHRSGRMWLLNSLGIEHLLAHAAAPPGLERADGRYTGRLFDEDAWLRTALGSRPPDLDAVSRRLASCGVTGVTDMSPANDAMMAAHFDAEAERGALRQSLTLAGKPELNDIAHGHWHLGPTKLHLHEAALPDFDETCALIAASHRRGRPIAVHCVSEVELVFALALVEAAGALPGDRIEHVSVASPDLVERMAGLGLHACVQPHFIAERGDRYLADVEPRHHADLYRLASLCRAGIVLAGGSDAPFGSADPWAAMRAAVLRTTSGGTIIGADEAVTPEAALDLFLADPAVLTHTRSLSPGGAADCVLLTMPWQEARSRLDADLVRLTIASGEIIHDGIDQPPVESDPGADPAA